MPRLVPVDHDPFARPPTLPEILAHVAAMGQGGDSILAHLSRGDTVISAKRMTDPKVKARVETLLGKDFARFVAGGPENRLNQKTGLAEFDEGSDGPNGANGNGEGTGGGFGGASGGGGGDIGGQESAAGVSAHASEAASATGGVGGVTGSTAADSAGMQSSTAADAMNADIASSLMSNEGGILGLLGRGLSGFGINPGVSPTGESNVGFNAGQMATGLGNTAIGLIGGPLGLANSLSGLLGGPTVGGLLGMAVGNIAGANNTGTVALGGMNTPSGPVTGNALAALAGGAPYSTADSPYRTA